MDEQQQQIVSLVLAAMQGDLQATQQVLQILLTAEMIKQVILSAQQLQQVPQLAPMAKNGAKLEYIKYLRGECPQGYEMKYFKTGGKMCKKCMKKKMEVGGEVSDPIADYKRKYSKK